MYLQEFIKGKTVCFVGMSPCIVGKGLGKEIDSFDVVLRTNIIPIPDDYQVDYGTKCDVLSLLKTSAIHPRFSSYGIKWVIHYPPLDKGKAPKDLSYFHMDIKQRNIVKSTIIKAVAQFPGHGTAGVNIITLVAGWEPKSLKAFGITGYQDKNGNVVDHGGETKHYIDYFPLNPNKKYLPLSRHPSHKLVAQNAYIRHLIKTGRLTLDPYSMEYFK